MNAIDPVAKFDHSRAAEYETQSRIALAGYDACHELGACLLSAHLGSAAKTILVAGAGGTGQEIRAMGRLEPHWRFVAADPSAAMLEQAMQRVHSEKLSHRVQAFDLPVEALPMAPRFDAATLIGVLHHVPSADAKHGLLRALAERLQPGAPLIIAGNCHVYESQPLFLQAWARRWRMAGASEAEVAAKLGKIRSGAVPPGSEAEVEALLAQAGFARPLRFFSSLFWSAWIAFKG
ncbi:class I SAM-dependent methyltransferase [Comamonas endophytica]|uniref:Class I SAM-dependent methyltransferase n=1 Tax=Comamonas endophytica TaxID=2949090 RepID=A0ABY6GBV5_9BURK|nr:MULTISPECIES: class I SAM-dependent methyltransferase [unclassified Acidovorax]MCD2513105.1 class I SAM-dependent methyltransferase [Acidovorax sp. D4N7]UYG52556.1 class I SAM-dependent methyltransferase [Acidovorax sp. 5MLIR]